jgi:hypothetical protein
VCVFVCVAVFGCVTCDVCDASVHVVSPMCM